MQNQPAKPFLKWAGGKTQLLGEIGDVFPFGRDESFHYIEPFVGSGAVLFWVLNNFPKVETVVINDFNSDLTTAYKTIAASVEELIQLLEVWQVEYENLSGNLEARKAYYYKKRELFNARSSDGLQQTALFIFLNRTCFNGLFRVNRNNEFNVPMGNYKNPRICHAENLRAVSSQIQRVTILNGDFENTLDSVGERSLVYLDPPYKPLSATSSFNSYAHAEFDDQEQVRLKQFCDAIDGKRAKWILSNSDVKSANPADEFFDDLYSEYDIRRVMARRNINSDSSKRGKLRELLITNFPRRENNARSVAHQESLFH